MAGEVSRSGVGFAWNAFERMALDASVDPEEAEEVTRFWDRHFPFAIAVHSDYDYLAVCLTEESFGAVVHGFAPDWEDPSPVSATVGEFLEAFAAAAVAVSSAYPYDVFL